MPSRTSRSSRRSLAAPACASAACATTPRASDEVVATVRALDGVTAAEANPLTGALLVRFDPAQTDVREIVAALDPPLPVRRPRASERAPYLRLVVG